MGPSVMMILTALHAQIAPSRAPVPPATRVAAGAGWTLEQVGQTIWLVEGRRRGTATITGQHQTPWNIRIDARGTEGAVVGLTITFAVCRVGDHRASHAVRLSWGGRILTGCYLRPPPLAKPLLD